MSANKAPREPAKLEIKVPALLAGTVTSVVVAVLASRLGVQGTLIGAAFTSLAFGLLSPFLTFGLQRSHEGLQVVAARRRPDAPGAVDAADTTAEAAAALPALERPRRRIPLGAALAGVAATAALTFGATLGVVTAYETAAGRSVDGGSGTTIERAAQAAPAASDLAELRRSLNAEKAPSAKPTTAPSASASPATAAPTAEATQPAPVPSATTDTPTTSAPAPQRAEATTVAEPAAPATTTAG